MEQGAFPGSRGSDNSDEFATLDLKVDSLEDWQLMGPHRKGLVKIRDFDHRGIVNRHRSFVA